MLSFKKMLATLLLLPTLVFGAANDVIITQRNTADNGTVTRFMPPPPGGANGIIGYNGSINQPTLYTIGSGLSVSGSNVIALPQSWSDITGKPVLFSGYYSDLVDKPVLFSGSYNDLTNKPVLFSGAYADLTGKPSLFDGTWSSLTGKPTTLAGYGITDAASISALTSGLAAKYNVPTGTNLQYIRGDGSLATFPTLSTGTVTSVTAGTGLSGGTITTTGTISLPNIGTAGTYVNVTTDAQGRVTAGQARSFTYPTRALNTAFQVSTTQDAHVTYTVDISVTSLLLAGSSGRVYLEYADNAAMTTNLVTVNESPNSVGGVLNITNVGPGNIQGWIPAGKYVRIRTAAISGSPTFTFVRSAEVIQ